MHCEGFKSVVKERGCWRTFMFRVHSFRLWECVFGVYRNQCQHI